MEATTLQKKKNTISKGKLKKNVKNVLCQPDKVFWPEINEEQRKRLEIVLKKYSIQIPLFKKHHWKELKLIPKTERPKAPKIKKVEGLLFGISECSNAIECGQCSAVIIEASVNPRIIVQPVIEFCTSKSIPLLCMTNLRNLTYSSFGIKTSCLGLKNHCLPDLRSEILDVTKLYPMPKSNIYMCTNKMNIETPVNKAKSDKEIPVIETDVIKMDLSESPYLYRTNKKTRVFIPITQDSVPNSKKCVGQDFINFTDKIEQENSKKFMKMVLKKISNNPNRIKKNKPS